MAINNKVLNEGYSDLKLFSNTKNGKIVINNKSYYDLSNCAGSLILGHNSKIFKKSLINLNKKNVSNYAHPNHYAINLANLISGKIRNINQVIFCNSGTEAIYKALRLCRSINKKKYVVSATGSWHGSVDQFLYSQIKNKKVKMSEGLNKFEEKKLLFIPYNDIPNSLKILNKFKKNINSIFIEPIQGCLPIDNMIGYLKFLEDYCRKNKILLVFDEIITGFRLKKYSIQNKYNIKPDLTILGKIIGGGMPIGAIGVNKNIVKKNSLQNIFFGGTFSGNSISCFVGFETLKFITQNKNIISKINKRSSEFQKNLNLFFDQNNIDAKVYRHESILRIIFSKKRIYNRTVRDFFEKKKLNKISKLRSFLYEKRIIYPKSGIIFFASSFSNKDFDYISNAFKKGLKKVF